MPKKTNKHAKTTSIVKVTKTETSRPRKRSNSSQKKNLSAIENGYIETLIDPFSHGPVKLGNGTMLPTNLGTSRGRGSFNLNATDGSGWIQLFLSNNRVTTAGLSPVGVNNQFHGSAGISVYGTTPANQPSFANVAQMRIVSAGVKAYPLISATSIPGIVDLGNFPPPTNTANFVVATTDSLINSACMHRTLGNGSSTYAVTWRPEDVRDYDILPTTDSTQTGSIPVITFSGFPASTIICYEYVVNFEYTVSLGDTLGSSSSSVGEVLTQHGTLQEVRARAESSMGVDVDQGTAVTAPYDSISDALWLAAKVVQGAGHLAVARRMGNL